MNVLRLSALRTGCLYLPGNISSTHFCQRLSRPQEHSAAGRIMSTKNSDDTFGNRTLDLRACSPVPQPSAPPRASNILDEYFKCEAPHGTIFSILLSLSPSVQTFLTALCSKTSCICYSKYVCKLSKERST